MLSELSSDEGLPERPPIGDNIVAFHGAAIAGGDSEREALAVEVRVALPILPPISGHCFPIISPWAFDGDRLHITRTSNVGNKDQIETRVAVYGEPYASLLLAPHPTHSLQQHLVCNSTPLMFYDR